jgi:hypothetical protein
MELQVDSWITETQTTLKGVTTVSLKGQHTRLKRARALQDWHTMGVADDGQLAKTFMFVDQQELLGRKNKSRILSSIRSHVKQDSYVKNQATKADIEQKKRSRPQPVIPKRYKRDLVDFKADGSAYQHDENTRGGWQGCQSSAISPVRADDFLVSTGSSPSCSLKMCTGYDALDRPRALFLLDHCKRSHVYSLLILCFAELGRSGNCIPSMVQGGGRCLY